MIDEQRLQELEDDFGAEDLAEIIDVFLQEVADGVDALGGMLSDTPHEERKAQLHLLKGCARNLGATALGDLCERYEQAEVTGAPFGQTEYAEVTGQFDQVRAYFDTGSEKKFA